MTDVDAITAQAFGAAYQAWNTPNLEIDGSLRAAIAAAIDTTLDAVRGAREPDDDVEYRVVWDDGTPRSDWMAVAPGDRPTHWVFVCARDPDCRLQRRGVGAPADTDPDAEINDSRTEG